MEGLISDLIKCHVQLIAMQDAADDAVSFSREDALAVSNLLAAMCDCSQDLARKKRACAGRYWRDFPQAKDAIAAFNAKDRKRQKVNESSSCCGKEGDLSFDKSYVGPKTEQQPFGRPICDACGSALIRDTTKNFIAK